MNVLRRESFSGYLKSWLAEQQLSAERAAPLFGVGTVTVYAWLNEEFLPSMTKLPILSRSLGIEERRLRLMLFRPHRKRKSQ